MLPVAVLAWLGVAADRHGRGLGCFLRAQALRDCHEAGRTFAFVAVILDCIYDTARAFYRHFDFAVLPGQGDERVKGSPGVAIARNDRVGVVHRDPAGRDSSGVSGPATGP